MQQAIDIILEKDRPMISVPPETTIYNALKIMVENQIGAIVITEQDKVVGIWTERDLLNNSAQPDFNPQTALIGDYMQTQLKTVNYDEPIFKLQDRILGMYVRHLFVVQDDEIIGLLSAGDITRACLLERTKELENISWEYYENWRWERRKK
ncbi:MAG: CBS domain-containing protein [Candidatus Marinimicrobia bacterium]|nr:CBS domain-containing protein [Candidatus Neomarinimicrobiota bacterium]